MGWQEDPVIGNWGLRRGKRTGRKPQPMPVEQAQPVVGQPDQPMDQPQMPPIESPQGQQPQAVPEGIPQAEPQAPPLAESAEPQQQEYRQVKVDGQIYHVPMHWSRSTFARFMNSRPESKDRRGQTLLDSNGAQGRSRYYDPDAHIRQRAESPLGPAARAEYAEKVILRKSKDGKTLKVVPDEVTPDALQQVIESRERRLGKIPKGIEREQYEEDTEAMKRDLKRRWDNETEVAYKKRMDLAEGIEAERTWSEFLSEAASSITGTAQQPTGTAPQTGQQKFTGRRGGGAGGGWGATQGTTQQSPSSPTPAGIAPPPQPAQPQVDYSAEADQAEQMPIPPSHTFTQESTAQPLPGAGTRVENQDGTFSTERTIGVNIDGREYVIPTLVDGKQLDEQTAVNEAKRRGLQNYPSFNTVEEAEQYAQGRSAAIGGAQPHTQQAAPETDGQARTVAESEIGKLVETGTLLAPKATHAPPQAERQDGQLYIMPSVDGTYYVGRWHSSKGKLEVLGIVPENLAKPPQRQKSRPLSEIGRHSLSGGIGK